MVQVRRSLDSKQSSIMKNTFNITVSLFTISFFIFSCENKENSKVVDCNCDSTQNTLIKDPDFEKSDINLSDVSIFSASVDSTSKANQIIFKAEVISTDAGNNDAKSVKTIVSVPYQAEILAFEAFTNTNQRLNWRHCKSKIYIDATDLTRCTASDTVQIPKSIKIQLITRRAIRNLYEQFGIYVYNEGYDINSFNNYWSWGVQNPSNCK